jgi:mRNA interferase MazF
MATQAIRLKRGQIWEVDFEPQTHKSEPGKRGRPALVIQTDILNDAGHATVLVIPATTKIYRDANGDGFPMRVAIGTLPKSKQDTDLLIDQMRAISVSRLMGNKPVNALTRPQLKRVEDALKILLSL